MISGTILGILKFFSSSQSSMSSYYIIFTFQIDFIKI